MRKNDLQADSQGVGAIPYYSHIKEYQSAFIASYAERKSWEKVAEPYPGLHRSMARMIANGYQPGKKIRAVLRLNPLLPAPVCSVCGEVHTTKRCTKRAAEYKDLFATPQSDLLRQLVNREEMKDV